MNGHQIRGTVWVKNEARRKWETDMLAENRRQFQKATNQVWRGCWLLCQLVLPSEHLTQSLCRPQAHSPPIGFFSFTAAGALCRNSASRFLPLRVFLSTQEIRGWTWKLGKSSNSLPALSFSTHECGARLLRFTEKGTHSMRKGNFLVYYYIAYVWAHGRAKIIRAARQADTRDCFKIGMKNKRCSS